ncbi:DedA family protein [Terracoccus luteus]|uniref:Membrane protein DedA with SNARE-associated domain n=1 Tax=Terracoccus luteus TaxID=53356 RepID=A0A839PWW0_9MICO|nr:hypothetical protein [Terracoccus luteus]MBB2987573.1 membrane protein DedA with SNARE-associated domain [Terracoccus luteus]MCP2173224.1 membrane protein DedA with SNARE-associated domain [Terracoccus luteus]
MLDRLAELPFWQAFAALFVIVFARSNATYWVGRGAVAGWRRRAARADSPTRTPRPDAGTPPPSPPTRADGEEGDAPDPDTADRHLDRGTALVRRLGPVAVTLSYLTVGVQTAVHLASGALRMPLRHYLPAAVVGSGAWAGLYATVGIAVVQAWVAAEAGSWWGVAVVGLVAVAALAWWVGRRRTRTRP